MTAILNNTCNSISNMTKPIEHNVQCTFTTGCLCQLNIRLGEGVKIIMLFACAVWQLEYQPTTWQNILTKTLPTDILN